MGRTVLVGLLLAVVAVDPAIAQSGTNVICQTSKLPAMIEGLFQLTTGAGIVGLVLVWQFDALIELFTLNPKQKKAIKEHKRSALKSTATLVVLGPLYSVAGTMMGLPMADCVNLAPW